VTQVIFGSQVACLSNVCYRRRHRTIKLPTLLLQKSENEEKKKEEKYIEVAKIEERH